jgi:diphthine-ammonia ligase
VKRCWQVFESLGVDACGERGEYHTLVFASPRMSSPLELHEVGRLLHDGYWMLEDLTPARST